MPAKYGGFSPYISEKSDKNVPKTPKCRSLKKSATADLTVELEVLLAELTVAVFCQMAQVTTLLHEIHYYQKHDSFS